MLVFVFAKCLVMDFCGQILGNTFVMWCCDCLNGNLVLNKNLYNFYGDGRDYMAQIKTIDLKFKYGFPNFTKTANNIYLCGSQNLILSDIWAFWDYVIKKNGYEKDFMASLLEQAKNFYIAAEKSPVNSRPLLYYYSFLNFAKVMINLEKKYGKNVTYMHGVKERNNGRFVHSEITIEAIKNHIKNVSAELHRVLDSRTISTSLTLNLRELLSHCVGIHRTYCEIYNMKESFCKLMDIKLIKTGRIINLSAKVQCRPEQLTELVSIGYNVTQDENSFSWEESYRLRSNNITREGYYNFSQILRDKGIWYFIGNDGYTNYLSTNPGYRYSPEFIIYNTMFYLGSITRYHPYLFNDIFSDKEQWLMSEFLTTQPKQFLYLSTAKILSQNVLKAYAEF
ncbi:hypothetical protein DCCM_0622 [Desulfocucumis palustris]|uniref:Uncharacterized protein n=1 Tax=Desulfocucumis palustris TaxID=1898651 RepID=A0A2L2X8J5_9FIRM|nr:YaaC family protein [Desulfocucumis palustris]GBF32428.1 hypothetical protein DCCM_0622 [Desulfocucumis palustris]